jgi:excisionase family DNA binding protein
MNKLTFTVEEAAKILGIGRSSAYEATRTGRISTIKIGHRILVLAGPLAQSLGVEIDSLYTAMTKDFDTVKSESDA